MIRMAKLHARDCVDYEMMIREALPGIKVHGFEAEVWSDGDTNWQVSLSAPADVLIGHGLISAELLASLPPCGVGNRDGLEIRRGKKAVNLCRFFHCDRLDNPGEDAARKLEAILLAILLPAIWSPKSAA